MMIGKQGKELGKNIVRNAIRGIVVCVILYAFGISVMTAGHLLRPTSVDTSLNSIGVFKTFPDYCFELMILGSSTAWCGIDPVKLEAEYGITSYNYSLAWQHLNTTKLFLQDLLQSQKPRILILETDAIANGLLVDQDMGGEIWYTRSVGNFRDKIAYLSQCFGHKWGNYVSYAVPALAFHGNWKDVGEESFAENANDKDFFALRGFMSHKGNEEIEVNLDKPDAEELEQASLDEMDQICEICRQNDIRLVLCMLPKANRSPYEDALQAYCEAREIPFFNCYDHYEEIGLLPQEDFYNDEHLDTAGADKVTDRLMVFMTEQGIVPGA